LLNILWHWKYTPCFSSNHSFFTQHRWFLMLL
jgi:hypothetical protein